MIAVEMPPPQVRNSDPVRVESLLSGTTAHAPDCSLSTSCDLTVTAVEAWVFLRATWCPRCMGRRQR